MLHEQIEVVSLWRYNIKRAQTAWFFRFIGNTHTHTHTHTHTQTHTHTHTHTHKGATHGGTQRTTCMHSTRFEPAIPATKRLQAYALNHRASEIGEMRYSAPRSRTRHCMGASGLLRVLAVLSPSHHTVAGWDPDTLWGEDKNPRASSGTAP
jgi:hypothetical protein